MDSKEKLDELLKKQAKDLEKLYLIDKRIKMIKENLKREENPEWD